MKWAALRNGEIIYGPGPLPYYWTDPATGDPHQMNALTLAERVALGWQEVETRGEKAITEGVEVEVAPIITVEDGRVIETKQYEFVAGARDALVETVDEWAEQMRASVAQSRPLQTMVYQVKLEEARALQTDPAPIEEEYPLLAASIGIEGETLQEVAAVVLEARAQWTMAAAAIERARLMTQKLVAEATTNDEAAAVAKSTRGHATIPAVAQAFGRQPT